MLCDQALQTLSPGAALVQLLEYYANLNWRKHNAADIAKYCRVRIGDEQDYAAAFVKETAAHQAALNSRFAAEAFQWFIDRCISTSRGLRRESRTYFLRPIISPDPVQTLIEIAPRVPSPTIVQNAFTDVDMTGPVSQAYALGGNDKEMRFSTWFSGVLYITGVFEQITKGSPKQCPLWTSCQHAHLRNIDCKTYPWRKGGEDKMCHIGAANKYVGIIPPK